MMIQSHRGRGGPQEAAQVRSDYVPASQDILFIQSPFPSSIMRVFVLSGRKVTRTHIIDYLANDIPASSFCLQDNAFSDSKVDTVMTAMR